MATIKDIAQLAGVSHGTVSNVLNGRGNVSMQKILQVEKAAHQLGYSMDERARWLRQPCDHAIGIVLPNLQNDCFATLYSTLSAHMQQAGYYSFLYLTNDIPDQEEAALSELAGRKVSVVVLVTCQSHGSDARRLLKKSGVLLLCLVRPTEPTDALICFVTQRIARQAAALLADRHPAHLAMISGLLAGSLTSTPAFSATKEAVAAQYQDAVTVGYGIAYLFGVIGVVLFVQLMPRVVHADLDEERRKITHVETSDVAKFKGKLLEFDDFGFTPFAIAAVFGILLGSVKFFNFFSLTTTGGALLVSLVFGHFGHIGRADLMPSKKVLETFRELGLMVFLIGAGVSGGMSFVRYFKPIYFVYGIFMTLLPMVMGYVVAKHVLKMNLLNILGSITGGMTSTPALGTLIHVAGTSNVASAYAATYPIALIAVVLVSQLIVRLF